MKRSRERFRARWRCDYDDGVPLIGVVGEIFCRLNTFSNEDLIRKLESYGAQAWLSDIPEWILYTNSEQLRKLKLRGQYWSTRDVEGAHSLARAGTRRARHHRAIQTGFRRL